MIQVTTKGNFNNSFKFFKRVLGGDIYRSLERYAEIGVIALASATPVNSGLTSNSWDYLVTVGKNPSIKWFNTNVTDDGTPVVILLQYGHGTGTGGYVQGQDFINPAIRPIFDRIAEEIWKEVTR